MLQFLNPLMLWGLAAASVPIIIHLLNRRRFQRQRWAAMEWLLAAVKKHQRRLRIESLLLLLLRTLVVLLLALALARPFLSDSPITVATSRQTHLFVVLDDSASMGARSGLRTAFEEAVSTASSLIGEIGSEDPITVILTNDDVNAARPTGRPRVLFRESRDHDKVRRVLDELKPAPARADLLESLKALDEAMPEGGALAKKVAILTDMQRVTIDGPGGRTSDDDGEEPVDELRLALERLKAKGAEVLLMPVGRDVDDVGVVSLRLEDERDVVQGAPTAFVAELVNHSDKPQRVELRFLVDGRERGDAVTWIELPPRPAVGRPTARSHRFSVRFAEDEIGTHVVEARIPADAFTADDARSYAFEVRPRLRVLAVDGDPHPGGDGSEMAETFLLAPILAIREDGPIAVRVVDEAGFAGEDDLSTWDMIILANVSRPAPDERARERLEAYVASGGSLLLTVGDNVLPDIWNDELWQDGKGLLPARLNRIVVREKGWLEFDLGPNRHPILRDITDEGNAAFFESPIQRGFIQVDEPDMKRGARTVLRFTDLENSPALAERRHGRGRVLMLTTTVDDGWGDAWSGLHGSYVFPVLLHETVYVMTARGNDEINLLTFQPYSRTFPRNFDDFELTYPDGSPARPQIESPPDSPSSAVFRGTTQLGTYRTKTSFKAPDILSPAPPPETGVFTVNLTALEADLRRVDPAELETRLDDLITVSSDLGVAADTVRANEGEVWRSMIGIAILLLVAEVALARFIGTQRTRS